MHQKMYLNIWFDILTPKQLHFFEPMIRRLEADHNVMYTSRQYGEVAPLVRIRDIKPEIIGRHGGGTLESKLKAGISRMDKLLNRVLDFSPDVLISCTSPEAGRIAFGLGIKHIAFSDCPHQAAVMKLTLPFAWKLLTPWLIPAKEFTTYGIKRNDVIHYKAIDAAFTIKRKEMGGNMPLPFVKKDAPNILIRPVEDFASYVSKSGLAIPFIQRVVFEFGTDYNVVVLARYPDQARSIRNMIRTSIPAPKRRSTRVILMKYDGKHLLNNTDLFVGSGGTMTMESALYGVPTLSYGVFPSTLETFLARKHLLKVEPDPDNIVKQAHQMLKSNRDQIRKRADAAVSEMEDPADVLINLLATMPKNQGASS